MNYMSDWTKDEVKQRNGYIASKEKKQEFADFSEVNLKDLPDSWDWRDHGAVTSVKDQGHCGSCWAFSVTATVESAMFISGMSQLTDYSAQQVLDCSRAGNCKGG